MMLTPEQLAELLDMMRVRIGLERVNDMCLLKTEMKSIIAHIDAQQARIDALMLEFCPEEMTEEQKAECARNQVPASQWPEDTSDYGSRIAVAWQNGNEKLS